jgi:creatinine amidohydrolase
LFTCWRNSETDWRAEEDGLGIQTDHAGANETSLMLALHPELVRMERLPEDPEEWPEAVLGEDPRVHASAEVGRQAIRLQGERMARLLREELARL